MSSSIMSKTSFGKRLIFAPFEIHVQHLGKELWRNALTVPRYHFLSNHFHHTMKSREYCCCAIPMVNAGIYATLIEQVVAGVLAGALAFSSPPSTSQDYPMQVMNLAAFSRRCCTTFVFCAVAWDYLLRCGSNSISWFYWCCQGAQHSTSRSFRMLSQAKEKPILYRRYVTLHGIIICVAFATAAVWVIISATRHSTASSNCMQRFFPDSSLQSQGQTLCNIFPWVDVGIMAGLWVLLAFFQVW